MSLEIQTNLARLHALQARISQHYQAGEDDAALAELATFGDLAPAGSESRRLFLYWTINIVGVRRKQFDAVIPMTKQAVTEFPQSREFWFLKGRMFSLVGRDEDAISALEKAAKIDAKHPAAAEEIARIKQRMAAREAAARQAAERALLQAVNEDAKTHLEAGNDELAWECLARVRELAASHAAPPRSYYRMKLEILGFRRREFAAAAVLVEEAIAAYPDVLEFWILKGRVLVELGRPSAALRALKAAWRLEPKQGASAYEIGKILHRRRRRRMAVKVLALAAELGVEAPFLFETLAVDRFYLGEPEACLAAVGQFRAMEGGLTSYVQRFEELATFAIATRSRLALTPAPASVRHITIGGTPYIGSTVLGALLGSTPGAAHAGEAEELVRRSSFIAEFGAEIDFDRHPRESYGHCRVCGPSCAVLSSEFRAALARDPVDYYGKIGRRLNASVLISGDKGVMHKERRDPLFQSDLLVLYKSPITWIRSKARQQEKKVARGEIQPSEMGSVRDWLREWTMTYEALLALPIPESRKVVVNWDEFVGSPFAHFDRLLRRLGLDGDPSVFEDIRFGHFIGGNGQSSVSEILKSGRVTFRSSDAPPLSDADEAVVLHHPEAQALARRLDRRYRMTFGDVAGDEGALAAKWSSKKPRRGRPLDAKAAKKALREPVVLPGPFEPIGGRGFTAKLHWPPHHLNLGSLADTDDEPGRSPLIILEDGRPLGFAHGLIADIRDAGEGRFLHSEEGLYFSTSDNSDPNLNGRTYAVGVIVDYKPQLVYRWNTVVAAMEMEAARSSLNEPVALIGPFAPDGGHAFLARLRWLPQHAFLEAISDRDLAPSQSSLIVLENGQPLGLAHAGHADIRAIGQGRFSHWKEVLYFSASDNSNPNTNGRTYAIGLPKG